MRNRSPPDGADPHTGMWTPTIASAECSLGSARIGDTLGLTLQLGPPGTDRALQRQRGSPRVYSAVYVLVCRPRLL